MSFLAVFFIILYVLVCIFLILVVLLQQGKGADLAGAFGGGGSQTSFGPRTSTNIMHRLTTISFVAFVILSMGLAILAGQHRSASVVAEEPTPTPVAEQTEPGISAEPGGEAAETAVEETAGEAQVAPDEGTSEEAVDGAPPAEDGATVAEPEAAGEAASGGEPAENNPEENNGA